MLVNIVNAPIPLILRFIGAEAFIKENSKTMTKNKNKTIAFRLTDEEFARIEEAARGAAVEPNEWCRRRAIIDSGSTTSLSPNEKIIFEEIVKTRYLISHGLRLMASNELNSKNWIETKTIAESDGEKIADKLLERRKK